MSSRLFWRPHGRGADPGAALWADPQVKEMHPGKGTSPEPLWFQNVESRHRAQTRMATDQAWGPGLLLPLSVQPQASVSTCGPQFLLSGVGGAGLPGGE